MFSCSELTFDYPFESAAILSLVGVNCIIVRQWNCKLKDNKEKFIRIFEGNFDCSKMLNMCSPNSYSFEEDTELAKRFFLFLATLDENKNIGNALRSSFFAKPETNTEQETTVEEISSTQFNPVMYGVPYFMLNPLKT